MNSRCRRRSYPGGRSAVTLLELLTVISIIALLLSILLPSMAGTWRTSQRVACMNNLRELARGAALYGLSQDGWIIGAPNGSGAYLYNKPVAFGPAVQRWDFLGPMAKLWNMGLAANDGAPADWAKRFDDLRSRQPFLCPANQFLALRFSGPVEAGTGPMVSYNTCRFQMVVQADSASETPFPDDPQGLGWYGNDYEEKLPHHWRPSIPHIGIPANKVFCADGARYSTCTIPPDFELGVQARWGGAFSDTGPYSTFTNSWDRSRAPGNGDTGPVDARKYAFRHSLAEPPVGAPGNAFLLNLAFYDGHVETMGDLDASHPKLWLPAGTVVTPTSSVLWPDAIAHFGLPSQYTVPQ